MREHIPFWSLDIENFKAGAAESIGYQMKTEHAHHHHEIMFNFSRIPVRHTAGGQVYESNTPYILYRAPYMLHSSSTLTQERYRRYLLAFHPAILAEYGGICDLGRLRGRTECLIPVNEHQLSLLEPLLHRLWWADCDRSIPDKAWIGALAALLYEISSLVPQDLPKPQETPQYIQDLLYYIVENTDGVLNINTLAEKFFISRTKLLHDFQAATRMPLHEYVTAIRIARAKIWLDQNVPISIVAQRCGYAHESAFIYMFRRETGLTPGEYKRESR